MVSHAVSDVAASFLSRIFRLQGIFNRVNLSIEKKVAADWQLTTET
jgi:hypothetical protein